MLTPFTLFFTLFPLPTKGKKQVLMRPEFSMLEIVDSTGGQ
jgi:hypothetical protein